MKETPPLTSLRGLAAFLVFMYHYAVLYPPAMRGVESASEWIPLMPLWRQGQVGVSIFFVLSGFLITRIYCTRFQHGEVSLRLFLVKRIGRIWPLFVVFACVQHAVMFGREGADSTWLVTMTMTQGFFSELRYAGLPTAWSLTIEESFYVLAPLLFLFIGLFDSDRIGSGRLTVDRMFRVAVALGLVIVGLAGAGFLISLLTRSGAAGWQGFMHPHHNWLHGTIFGRFPEFAIGAAGAFLHRDPRFAGWFTARRGLWLQVLCFVGMGLCMAVKNGAGERLTLVLTYAIALQTGLLILAMCPAGNWLHRLLSTRVAVFAGKISYGLYLVQLTVMMEPLLRLTDGLGYARMPVLYLLTSLFCAVVYRVVEVPARGVIVGRWGR